ncbi:protein TIFY 5A [Morus notabilis]|uniref:protein TIFY 5A n=1 Tax=Morus notabilis TaxID=981085 RepID=UPI000CECE9C9|nr:protein TIFY 5A [Morus notabilis]
MCVYIFLLIRICDHWAAMRKNCNFDNFSPFPFFRTNSLTVPVDLLNIPLMDLMPYSTYIDNIQHEVIIYFNGRTLVCDMIELQARSIILFASREMKGRKNLKGSDLELSTCLQSQIYGSPSLSMKRSLERFLQKRRQRSRASSPYNQ